MRRRIFAVLLSAIAVLTSTQVYAQKPKTEAQPEAPDVSWTMGMQAGEETAEFFGDAIVPVHFTKSGAFLVNVRGSGNDDEEEEANAGLVYRHLFPEKDLILGANIYYDSRWTAHDNRFDQMGAGLELLSRWIDARANLYIPENKEELVDSFTDQSVEQRTSGEWRDPYAETHHIAQDYVRRTETVTTTYLFERFEQAREGWDAELGVKLPVPDKLGEYRLFAGYYNWDAQYSGQDEISGFKARAEARILPALFFDASWYEDKELNGSDWFVGVRLNLPFDLGLLAEGKNPFAGAFSRPKPAPFSSRIFEMVIRDLKIQTEDSGYVENEKARAVDIKRSSSRSTVVLMDNITFVDDGNAGGIENGTAENPYNTIQEGVNAANSPVYVFDGTYNENVVMRAGVDLYGEGYGIQGMGGRVFGGQNYPVANGRSRGPTFTMVSNSSISGMRILNTDVPGAPPVLDLIDGNPYDISRVGVFGHDANDILIRQNQIGRSEHGIFLGVDSTPDYVARIQGNRISGAVDDGVRIEAVGGPGSIFSLLSSGNSYSGNGSDGIDVDVALFDSVFLSFAGDRASGNQNDGIDMDSCAGNYDMQVQIRNSTANNNDGEGFELGGVSVDGIFQGYFDGLRAEGNTGEGLDLEVYAPGPILAVVADSSFNNNLGNGLQMILDSDYLAVGLVGPDAALFESVNMLLGGFLPPQMNTFSGPGTVTANGNGGEGMLMMTDADSIALSGLFDVRASGNVQNGIVSIVNSDSGLAASLAMPSSDLLDVMDFGLGALSSLLGGPAMPNLPAAADQGPIRVNGNGAGGFVSIVDGPVALSAKWGIQANGNDGDGIQSIVMGDNVGLSLQGGIEASYNNGGGIISIVNGDDAAIGVALDTIANNNAGPGIQMIQQSDFGIAVGLVSSVRSLLDGAEILLNAAGLGPIRLPNYAQGSGTVANGNGAGGILMITEGDDGAYNGFMDVTANRNQAGPGIISISDSDNGPSLGAFVDVQAGGNQADGIIMLSAASDAAIGAFMNVTANGNQGNGILGMMDSAAGDVVGIGAGVTASGNDANGMLVIHDAAGSVYGLYTGLELRNNGANGMQAVSTAVNWSQLYFGNNLLNDFNNDLGLGLPPALLALVPQGGGIASGNAGFGLQITHNSPAWAVIINSMNFNNNVAGDWQLLP
ncbi:MAG: inverse autotransporter beta domain-containing protein [Kiritimatiellia bacterium]